MPGLPFALNHFFLLSWKCQVCLVPLRLSDLSKTTLSKLKDKRTLHLFGLSPCQLWLLDHHNHEFHSIPELPCSFPTSQALWCAAKHWCIAVQTSGIPLESKVTNTKSVFYHKKKKKASNILICVH